MTGAAGPRIIIDALQQARACGAVRFAHGYLGGHDRPLSDGDITAEGETDFQQHRTLARQWLFPSARRERLESRLGESGSWSRPSGIAARLAQRLSEPREALYADGWYQGRMPDGEWQRIEPLGHPGMKVLDPAALLTAVERLSTLAEDVAPCKDEPAAARALAIRAPVESLVGRIPVSLPRFFRFRKAWRRAGIPIRVWISDDGLICRVSYRPDPKSTLWSVTDFTPRSPAAPRAN